MFNILLSGVPKNINLRKLSLEIYILVITNLKSKVFFFYPNIYLVLLNYSNINV